ncbi:ABC transporter ATP-binding protein [Dictyoglomus thermophilum]|uniref:ABC transporter n=1 Tax=Dictyoglomus thermophilum (strain ATCC 35947 / DSM 3960 / H-6-12) TaxID=309799 RepID=B5YC62_DICT6|nr:ABC transporter ATP-binding protein [Dictyoglomus thermophilum]ACI19250.1 ABC transporter [Dictyoglomus thermophilum H-6-12]
MMSRDSKDLLVDVDNLKAYYVTRLYGINRIVKAVDNVSFEIYKNEILGIAGESGCGKSTLLKVLLRIIKPPLFVYDGSVNYFLQDKEYINIISLGEEEIKSLRWKLMSYIPQGSMNVLNPVRKIKNTFRDFIKEHFKEEFEEVNINKLIKEHLESLGLPSEVLDLYPHQLSGGMKQRVTIALSTLFKPKIIFADEPTTALDVIVQRGVLQLLKKIQREEKNTIVIVSHDMGIHAYVSQRIAIMYAGKIIEIADKREIYTNPLHPYTKYLINSLPRIGDKSYKASIPGTPPSLANPPMGCRFHERCPEAQNVCREQEPLLEDVGNNHKVACHFVKGGKL